MKSISRERFQQLVRGELDSLPAKVRELMVNVHVEIKDEPGLEAEEMEEAGNLLGLYCGPTRAEMLGADAHGTLPAIVYLYQRNLEDCVGGLNELKKEVRVTLRHELAHHFGFEDDELERVWPEGA